MLLLKSPRDPKWPIDLAGFTQRSSQPQNISNGSHNSSCQIKTATIYIFHEWKTQLKKDDLLAVIAEHFLLDYAWCKQTEIAPVLALSLYQSTPLTKNTCRYWILFSVQIDRITWRKTKPVTTTIILIRPLYWAGMSHMLLRPCCRGLEWLIILPSSLTALPCFAAYAILYCLTWKNVEHGQFSVKPFETPVNLTVLIQGCVQGVMKRLLIRLLFCDVNVALAFRNILFRMSLGVLMV